jgi:hypothetical protein
MMIAREGEAVMYQRTAEGGLEAVQRMRLPEGGGVGGGGGPHLPGGGGGGGAGGAAQPTIMEPFVGPSLQSPTELMSRYPGSNVIAAEGRFFPPAPEIEAFSQRGGQFIGERFPSSIQPGELQQIHVRYPLPHAKGLENISVDFMREMSPAMDPTQLLTRLESNIESVTNLGPYALERLAPNGTMEIVFYETEIADEIANLTTRTYTDAATGTRYTFEVVQAPMSVPRTIAPYSGYGIPPNVETVSHAIVRKVLAP